MTILCGQQNGWSVIYMQIARNNYSHYWLITTNSDPPTPSDMVSCLLSLNIKWFSIQTEAHLADLHRKARHEIFSARARRGIVFLPNK